KHAVDTQQRLLATAAEQVAASGDAMSGALIALEAMPDGPAANDAPDELRLGLYQIIGNLRERRLIPLVSRAEFSNDGRRILTTHRGNIARLFDVESGQEAGLLDAHANATLRQAIYSADQRQILTTAVDGTVRLWDTTSFDVVRTIQLNRF